jgi:mannosyltransferase OCH1-like enzyme
MRYTKTILIIICILLLLMVKSVQYKSLYSNIKPLKSRKNYETLIHWTRPIPKKIYRILPNIDSLKNYMPAYLKTKETNPDYEQILITDEKADEFMNEYFKDTEIYKAYYLINENYGVVRSDLLRLLLIYVFGGVYMDLKTSAIKPLNFEKY